MHHPWYAPLALSNAKPLYTQLFVTSILFPVLNKFRAGKYIRKKKKDFVPICITFVTQTWHKILVNLPLNVHSQNKRYSKQEWTWSCAMKRGLTLETGAQLRERERARICHV